MQDSRSDPVYTNKPNGSGDTPPPAIEDPLELDEPEEDELPEELDDEELEELEELEEEELDEDDEDEDELDELEELDEDEDDEDDEELDDARPIVAGCVTSSHAARNPPASSTAPPDKRSRK